MAHRTSLTLALLSAVSLAACATTSSPGADPAPQNLAGVSSEVYAMHQRFMALDTHLDTPAFFDTARGYDIMKRHDVNRDGSQVDQKGTYRIAQANGGFNASYKEGNETKRWRGTLAEYAAQGIDKKPGVELTATNRRVETFVTNGAPTEIKATNKGLELVAGPTHPNDLYSGEEATFKMLDNGKPAANVDVVVILGGDRYREEAGELKLKTGADGVLKVKFDKPGMYWLEAESTGTTTMEGKQLKSQSTYVAVLEVLPS